MLSWVVKKLISWVMARNRAGDIRATLALDAPDLTFVFPGSNTWSGTFLGRDAHRQWLERLVRTGIKTDVEEVVAAGFPWRMTASIRGRSWWDSPDGERIYANRYVIWAKLRWGRLQEYEVYEDTQKAQALDDYLAAHEPATMADYPKPAIPAG
jgi:ketosteroid isomerase-like protein